ncbi:MAG: phospho-N-acetylmuramoyl-pentapeptide-transferase [Candidatus Latescibacteria bacterium]|nr:phospho-N-acetylmuramoyl-pentapeptide-transferase [Candidatus Latescibacterota bacterium]NIM21075.1 phospho-N-acetylmuramoyl-pentapeptide-transferase [Candidatus Latescibacterota bacterium]NIM65210.1 phospho-N-acetylmuramoyl-pentapeptide-transferase [Candidatus Latescibacterota bacterium]NIO01725.1 phospho-N-acetylmuramoyl-pentapeptide-transferase [Candidatus Latescibacterota bacterium]NIO28242.1 phospho-N-acetylmuramoyl-pentapeptide-transferase [Candidatus Latescibacterota bacterium]
MLYHLLYPLHTHFSALNVFRYITFRAAYAMVTALIISFLLGPVLIRFLERRGVYQPIREEGPKTHQGKFGTPTMGGLLLLSAIVIPSLLWCNLKNPYVLITLATTLWMGLIGFLDDYLHAVKKRPKGLVGRYKLIGQITFGLALGCFLYFRPLLEGAGALTSIPFFKGLFINFGMFYIVLVMLVLTATSNSVNLTDGIDGLAVGLGAFCFFAFAGLAYLSGHKIFSNYLNILYLEGSGELSIYCMAAVGASLGFLWFNSHPAQVFMGDTGSLSLGGALGVIAVLLKRELLLLVIGGIFVAEALSVILQVGSFRFRKKRIFRMSPLHHHFELCGWAESKVVVRFWIIAALLALLSLSTLKLQ